MELSVIIPGHGSVMYDKKYVNNLILLFASAEEKVHRCISKGMTVEECGRTVNFEEFRTLFTYDDETNWAFTNYFSIPVIKSIYKNEIYAK